MFFMKKVIGPLFFPLALCLEVLLVGWVLLCFTRFQRSGKVLIFFGIVMLGLCSFAPFADRLLEPFEYQYPVISSEAVSNFSTASEPASPKWITVLGAGHTSNPELHPLSELTQTSLQRLVEGIRLYREAPGSKLLLMGGPGSEDAAESEIMARVARALGVEENDMVMEIRSRDTREQAEAAKAIVGDVPFLLVTSASHMPRAMALFKKTGTNPIPAPVGHLVKHAKAWTPDHFRLSARHLFKAERAFYEFLGMGWAWLWGEV